MKARALDGKVVNISDKVFYVHWWTITDMDDYIITLTRQIPTGSEKNKRFEIIFRKWEDFMKLYKWTEEKAND